MGQAQHRTVCLRWILLSCSVPVSTQRCEAPQVTITHSEAHAHAHAPACPPPHNEAPSVFEEGWQLPLAQCPTTLGHEPRLSRHASDPSRFFTALEGVPRSQEPPPPPRNLPHNYAYCPVGVLGGLTFSCERGTPVVHFQCPPVDLVRALGSYRGTWATRKNDAHRSSVLQYGSTSLTRKRQPPQDLRRALGIGLLQGPRERRFLTSEVPL